MTSLAEAHPYLSEIEADTNKEKTTAERLEAIIHGRQLSAIFQPIIHMGSAGIVGYEGLIRGPSDSPLHSPMMLFQAARECGLSVEIEYLSRCIVLESFARLGVSGKLFLNVSPETLLMEGWQSGETLRCIADSGLLPNQVVIELTENSPTLEYAALREATRHYRAMGFEIAMDDLGEGFSSLRLWSELRPDYVKIDKHFIQNINLDPIKLQFVRSIQEIARNAGCRVIAEGIETHAELLIVRDLGVDFGQGYYFAHPQTRPEVMIRSGVMETLKGIRGMVRAAPCQYVKRNTTVANLLKWVSPASTNSTNEEVFAMFESDPGLYSIPIVDEGIPVGLISRYTMSDRFARRFSKELFGRRSCAMMMDASPLIVESTVSLHELSSIILEMEPYHLTSGFIITDRGTYLGMGSGHDLLREITQMQIAAARYANPLTQMPGNVPINEHIDRLLQNGTCFCACYFDLDNFKPYNDVYGFRQGDDVIKLTSKLMQEMAHPELDFVGHIGGDDFIALFCSEDWETRCKTLLDKFAASIPGHYEAEDVARGGIEAEDRQGRRTFHPLASLSIGAVWIDPRHFASHHEVAAAASSAKKQAKKIVGNALFLDRRDMPPCRYD
ncbi:MAG TPA: GGDEF domain-containing protein [Methylophilaceae bacterium]|nr:GGDEF domain-containing protein [Methylophilaceae bacterium]